MASSLLLLVLATIALVEIEIRDHPPISVQVPDGWFHSTDPRSTGARFGPVFFTASNFGPDGFLVVASADTVRDSSGQPTSVLRSRDWAAFREQLPPGAVYVELHCPSPGRVLAPTAFYRLSPEDGPAHALKHLRDSDPTEIHDDLTVYRTMFNRWGGTWAAQLVARSPVRQEDVLAGLASLRSISFPESPILTEIQAIERAIEALPPGFELDRSKLSSYHEGSQEITCVGLEPGFRVRFTDTSGEKRTFVVLVREDGSVEVPLESN
ncbi:MAG: hypothetical protein DHS20C21_03380 [Gemmatimonadota bacterium]|nr:MAG: hypothetical protein DHS20C21_03380 [Gemmatimonadota bacterium]